MISSIVLNTEIKETRYPPHHHGRDHIARAITAYAKHYLAEGHLHSTLEEAAEQCALDVRLRSAKLHFKREVRRLQNFYPDDLTT